MTAPALPLEECGQDWDWAADPFGPDAPRETLEADPRWRDEKRKKGHFKAREHYPRAKGILADIHPGRYWACDRWETLYNGVRVSIDLEGFMDLQGASGGRFIAAQVTTLDAMGAHMRHYTDPSNTHGQAKERVVDLLRSFLRNGGTFLILGAHQPGGKGTKWHYSVMNVTEELMDVFIARKRTRNQDA